MRKIYSLVLMATMLLIGTNVSAVTHEVDNADDFYTYWQSANGDVIKLIDAVTLDKTLWLGTDSLQDDSRSIEINLNGYKLTTSADYGFVVTHGKLKITNSRPAAGGQIEGTGGQNLFYLSGSTKKDINPREDDVDYFTHLYIGAGVTLTQSAYCATIIVDGVQPGYAVYPKNDNYKPAKPQLKYATNVYAGYDKDYHVAANTWYSNPNKCVSNGVRIDVHGTIVGTKYGIQSHGYLGTKTHYDRTYASYIKVVEGDTLPTFYDQNNALANVKEYVLKASDTLYAPFIHVYPEARVSAWPEKTGSSKAPMGVYAAGYARWLLEGYIEGGVGVLIKSGTVDIQDATVVGTGPTYNPPASSTSGSNASGSAIVMDSGDSYVGDMDVTVGGDSHISAAHGYAIDEAVTTAAQSTKVDHITITGGTFVGGTWQSDPTDPATTITDAIMKVSEPTAVAAANVDTVTTITIIGANLSSDNANGVTIGQNNLAEFLEGAAASQGSTHITYVEVPDPNNPSVTKTTMVISAGDAPDPGNKVSNQATDASVKWQGPDYVTDEITASINEDHLLRLTELQINDTITAEEDEASEDPAIVSGQPRTQTLYIRNGATLEVERVILGPAARIIVDAGGKFIVNGTQGITAPVVDNIELRSTANEQAYFLFNPAVSSNKNPNASVVVSTVCRQTGYNPWTYVYQRIASPLKDTLTAAPANDFGTDMSKLYTADETNKVFENYLYHWDMAQEKWVVGPWNQMAPFTGYQLANNSQAGGVKYTFSGKLVGNQNGDYRFAGEGFDFFGNSYTAPIYIENIFAHFNNAGVQASVWVYDYEAGNYITITPLDFEDNDCPHWLYDNTLPLKEIAPFAGFIMKLDDDAAGKVAKLNYAAAIWGNPDVNPSAAAPARHSQETADRVTLRVDAANGKADMIKLVQSDRFSEAFDNGADASKYISENGINLYAVTNDGDLARVATNDLENTVLAFQAGDATEYTISVPAQSGETFMLRDLVTNQTMMMEAGATYAFNQEAYSTNNARFEIVAAAKMPTAIDNTEVKANVKGIYTITGQYVGENFEILPAGVYVVNGVKIVK